MPTLQNYQVPSLPQLPGGDPVFWRNELQKISKSINLLVAAVNPGTRTFATLPTTPFVGQVCPIKDSNFNTWGHTITSGGGAFTVLAHWNGTNWTVAAI